CWAGLPFLSVTVTRNVTLSPTSGAALLAKPVTARSGEPAPPPPPPPLLPPPPLPPPLPPPPPAGAALTTAVAEVVKTVPPPLFVPVTDARSVLPMSPLFTE